MTNLCRSARCARHLGGAVVFCPFCGSLQRAPLLRRHAPSEPTPVHQDVLAQPRPAAPPAPAVHEPVDQAAVLAEGGAVSAPVVDDGAAGRLLPGLRQFPRKWVLSAILAAAVLLLACMAAGIGSLAKSGAARAAGSCDGVIDAELAFFVDVPGPVDESTNSEILARLVEQLDAPFSGMRRISLFSTRHRGATPLIAVCTRPRLFATLFGQQGPDPALRSRFISAARVELGQAVAPARRQTLTQVLADVSVSKHSRSPMNTLVIFSGLREKWPGFDPHRCGGVQAAIAAYRTTRAGGVERPTFKSATIRLNVIPEPGAGREVIRCRRAFWNWYFGDFEGIGEGVSWEYLPGLISDAQQLTEKE